MSPATLIAIALMAAVIGGMVYLRKERRRTRRERRGEHIDIVWNRE